MKGELEKYLLELEENTEAETKNYTNRAEAFTSYVLSEISEKINISNYNLAHGQIKDPRTRAIGEIYGYNESENGQVLTLFYTIYEPMAYKGDIRKAHEEEVQTAWNRMIQFYDKAVHNVILDEMEITHPLYDAAKTIFEHQDNYITVRLYILSNCSIRQTDIKKTDKMKNKDFRKKACDIKFLFNCRENESDHEPIDVNLKTDYKYNIPFIKMSSAQYGYQCFLAMFPAKLLYRLYREHNTDLLTNNVRYFLGFKKTKKRTTNYDIRDTLMKNGELFLAYNNGITAISTGIETEKEKKGVEVGDEDSTNNSKEYISTGIINTIKDFQIVNGGQTTASIFMTKELSKWVNLRGVYVQVKIIVIPQDYKEKNSFATNITRSSNTQNSVKFSDYSVNNNFNILMQDLSRKICIPNDNNDYRYWFFERIRGQWEAEETRIKGEAAKENFKQKYPKELRFKKETLARVQNCWDQKPYDSVKGEGTIYDNFITKINDEAFIPDEEYYKESIAKIIIYNYLTERKENRTYEGEAACVKAYTMAYASYLMTNHINLMDIWNRQGLTDSQKKGFDLLSNATFFALKDLSGTDPIKYYCRRKNSWEEFQNYAFDCDIQLIKQMLRNEL